MATILCLETATTNCSVALSKDGEVVALREENSKQYAHSEKLHVFIEEVLKESGISKDHIDAVAVGKGPGSYTGLRIGVSAAKGLAFAWDVPVITLGTLEILAREIEVSSGFIIPLLDARRMEVYESVFDANHQQLTGVAATVVDENSFQDFLSRGTCTFLGDGALKLQKIINHPNAVFIANKFPGAATMAVAAEKKFKAGEFDDLAYFEPFYLKEFIPGK